MRSVFSSIDVSATGLSAERLRMEVIANNVANANSTSGPGGTPFRRQEVVFAAAMNDAQKGGVEVVGIQEDTSELPKIYKPSHPHADANGFVTMPNVVVANEMVDMMVANRSYEANLNAIKTYQQMAQNTLELLR